MDTLLNSDNELQDAFLYLLESGMGRLLFKLTSKHSEINIDNVKTLQDVSTGLKENLELIYKENVELSGKASFQKSWLIAACCSFTVSFMKQCIQKFSMIKYSQEKAAVFTDVFNAVKDFFDNISNSVQES